MAGAGLFLGGMGASAFYPLGVGLALARAPSSPVRASARLTLSSGSAIFAAPLVLGVIAQLVGVVEGWSLVLGLLGAGHGDPRRQTYRQDRSVEWGQAARVYGVVSRKGPSLCAAC